jgi:hypothetical protein
MLDQNAQALREQIIGKHIPSTYFESPLLKTHPANATLLFFLRIGPKDGHSDLIIAVVRNGKDTAAGVVVIKGDKLITLVDDVSAPSDMCALQGVFERSKIDLALAMKLAKENRKNDFGSVANGD